MDLMANPPDDHVLDASKYWDIIKELMEHKSSLSDIQNYPAQSMTATQVMMEEEQRRHTIAGARSHAKSINYANLYGGTVSGRLANTNWMDDVRPNEKVQFAVPAALYASESGRHQVIDPEIGPGQAPTNTQQDRHYLCLTKTEYDHFAEAIQTGCYLDKQANMVKLKNAKTKKLKNIRHSIRKSSYIMQSMIWQAQLRIIETEIRKRQHVSGGRHGQP